jgi:hypothetical protein
MEYDTAAHLINIASSLAFLIESHYHHCSTETLHLLGLLNELLLALLQADGVHNALALQHER